MEALPRVIPEISWGWTTFTQEEPWTLFEIPNLKIVIAGLNSTIAESHRDGTHYGYAGEAQLRWFAERLKPFKEKGWLRIGAVHHNYQRGYTDDDENLKDADDLAQLLGSSLNILLHGHTHGGQTNENAGEIRDYLHLIGE
jgi:3',5'-cyclic AMP phosphodiesterase CpdA